MNTYIKKFNGDTEVTIQSLDQDGNTHVTMISNYLDMSLFIYEDQLVISARNTGVSCLIKVDENNALIIKKDGEILGNIREPEDLGSVIGAEDTDKIQIMFTKLLLENTEKEFEPPFGEIHKNVRRV